MRGSRALSCHPEGLAAPRLVSRPAYTAALFDRNGNIGPTVWWHGRIVGAAQHADGHINTAFLADRDAAAHSAVAAEADRLSAFLAATRVTPCYRTPLERRRAQAGPSLKLRTRQDAQDLVR